MKHFIAMAVLGLGTAGFATDSAQAEHQREFKTSFLNIGFPNVGYSAYNTRYAPQVNYGGCYTSPYSQSYNTQYPAYYGNSGYNSNYYQGGYNNHPHNYGAYQQPYPYSGSHYNSGYGWGR